MKKGFLIFWKVLTLSLVFLPVRVFATTESLPSVLSTNISAGYFVKMGFALIAVFVFFMVFAWSMRRYQNYGQSQNRDLSIIASLSLGTKERLVVVQAGDVQVLLGITPTQINQLSVLTTPLKQDPVPEGQRFRSTLEQLLKKDSIQK